jgi:hypothetical protein
MVPYRSPFLLQGAKMKIAILVELYEDLKDEANKASGHAQTSVDAESKNYYQGKRDALDFAVRRVARELNANLQERGYANRY